MGDRPHSSVSSSAGLPLFEWLSAIVGDMANGAMALGSHAKIAMSGLRGNSNCVSERFCGFTNETREALLEQKVRLINSAYHSAAFLSAPWAAIAGGRSWRVDEKNKANRETGYREDLVSTGQSTLQTSGRLGVAGIAQFPVKPMAFHSSNSAVRNALVRSTAT